MFSFVPEFSCSHLAVVDDSWSLEVELYNVIYCGITCSFFDMFGHPDI